MEDNRPNALVTGASSGIGLAFAEVLAECGHNLFLTGRDETKLNTIREDLEKKYPVTVHVLALDLVQDGAAEYIYRIAAEKYRNLDVLINNAGIGDWGSFGDASWERQEQMIRLNILAVVGLTHLVLPQMRCRGSGKILNVASTAAFQPGPLMSIYYATKAFILSFSVALAEELRQDGIVVSCLCPPPTATGFQQRASVENIRLTGWIKPVDPKVVARYGFNALLNARVVAVPGLIHKIAAAAVRALPLTIVAPIVRFVQGKPAVK